MASSRTTTTCTWNSTSPLASNAAPKWKPAKKLAPLYSPITKQLPPRERAEPRLSVFCPTLVWQRPRQASHFSYCNRIRASRCQRFNRRRHSRPCWSFRMRSSRSRLVLRTSSRFLFVLRLDRHEACSPTLRQQSRLSKSLSQRKLSFRRGPLRRDSLSGE